MMSSRCPFLVCYNLFSLCLITFFPSDKSNMQIYFKKHLAIFTPLCDVYDQRLFLNLNMLLHAAPSVLCLIEH